ncbi:hypothetical protein Raf01_42170 [Rugosimonospora africana]|uniref:Uncharacterized protein n=1 Tax=Rugosimonospora africana TaxID=556532 RepID=A0A8J3VRC5_9ACTN|nr:hypothetical protein Raf01_42170 [Rugosimonospora africana]
MLASEVIARSAVKFSHYNRGEVERAGTGFNEVNQLLTERFE